MAGRRRGDRASSCLTQSPLSRPPDVYRRPVVSIADHIQAPDSDLDGIAAAALDYLEGYVLADSERHARAYHPEAIKRRYTEDEDAVR